MVSTKDINKEYNAKMNIRKGVCPECGSKYPKNADFCPECGKKILKSGHSKSNDNKKANIGGNGVKEKFDLWWSNRTKSEKIVTGLGACCVGFLILGIIGSALPQAERTVLEFNDFSSTFSEVKIDNSTTEYVIKGHSEPNATVTVNGQAITLDSNNQFSYKVNIPLGVTEQKVEFKAEKSGKDNNYGTITIKRPSSTQSSSSNSQSNQTPAAAPPTEPTPTDVTITQLYGNSIAKGTLVKVSGSVLQSDGYNLRIENADGKDILVEGFGLTAYEDQSVTVIGTFYGPSTYNTAMGSSRTVPTIKNAKLV